MVDNSIAWINPTDHDFPRDGSRFLAWGPGWLCPFPAYAVLGDPPTLVHCIAGNAAHDWTMPAAAWKPFDDPPAGWSKRPERWAALDCSERTGPGMMANAATVKEERSARGAKPFQPRRAGRNQAGLL